MCNLYDIGPGSDLKFFNWQRGLKSAIEAASKPFGVRKTDPGIVARFTPEKSSIEAVSMRWGFHRPFNPAINNARSDKLNGRMWDDAWREKRRCVIPVSTFYEWTGPTGGKQTHAFQRLDAPFLMAGLWELNPDPAIGLSFTMLTTDASDQVERIHHRMPSLLNESDIPEFLETENPMHLVQPFKGELKIFDCENPLKMKASDHKGPIPISMLPGF